MSKAESERRVGRARGQARTTARTFSILGVKQQAKKQLTGYGRWPVCALRGLERSKGVSKLKATLEWANHFLTKELRGAPEKKPIIGGGATNS